MTMKCVNTLNAKLNPICHLLTLLGAHHILHVSRIRVKKSCISNVVDGTDDDDMLWDDSEEEGNVRSECEEDEDGDSDIDW
jgi:hypothetical protein